MSLCKKRRANDQRNEAATSSNAKRSRNGEISGTQLSQSQLVGSLRCGKVVKMHLTNFMCHSNLSIDFHERVNFLVGSNGSGKSAVLAALVLGLGANAKATNRSGSVKKLIKTGENSAKIEITISNEGPEAYEADVYGNRITIVRTITQSAATYAIKNETGHVVSKKVDDLRRMLMYHNVQVDNPVFVLNQDSAREFLKELEPLKNYTLFLKATQIEMIMEKLTDCLQSHKDQTNRLSCFHKTLVTSKQEIKDMKAKLAQLMSLEKLKDVLSKNELERLWVLVTQYEDDLQEFLREIEQVEASKSELVRLVQNKDEMQTELTQEISTFDNEIADKNNAYTAENALYQKIKSKVTDMSDRCREVNHYIDSIKKRKSFIETQIRDLNTNIEDRSQNNMGNIAQLRQRNESTLDELRQTKEENGAIMETAKRDLKIFLDNRMQIQEKIDEVNRNKNHLKENIHRLSSQIGHINVSSKDKSSIYGEQVTQLLAEINRLHKANKFNELPRGPIGRYIEVPNGKYRDVVENQIGSVLKAFIVSNKRDRFTLESITKRLNNFHPTIITTRFLNQVYDVSNGRVKTPRGTRLLMDEIRCSDPVVMNCLIDRLNIETVLISDTKDIAEQITSHRENVPKHLSKVIVPKPGLEYHPEPKYRMYSMKIRNAQFIQVNVQDRINQLEMEKDELQNRLQTLEAELSNLAPQVRSDAKRIEEKRTLLNRQEGKIRELQEKISELENFEYPQYNEVDILKKELLENQRKLVEIDGKLNNKKIELNETKSEMDRFELELRDKTAAMQMIQQEIDAIKTDSDKIKMKLRSIDNNYRQNQTKLKEINDKLAQLETEKCAKLKNLNVATKEAQKNGERIPSERSEEEISEDIQRLKAKIRLGAQIDDDPKVLRQLVGSKEHTLETDDATFKNTKIAMDMLKRSLLTRFDFIKKLKQHMVLLLQFTFNHILKMRNFLGTIEVNHHDKTLTISVIPRDNHLENAVSNTKALSGGERSYSTVAFLISLWSCVDHPFYFLDEYDVFTDEVNREYMTRILINEGKKRPNRQYAFLTPQDMTIETQNFIKIHKLAEPDRR